MILLTEDIPEMVERAQEALLHCPHTEVFVRGGKLVRVREPDLFEDPRAVQPTIEEIPKAALREMMAISAKWVKGGEAGVEPTSPPGWVVQTLMERSTWPFPRLRGIATAPTLRTDGSVITVPGYDIASGMLYHPSGPFPPVPSRVTHEAASAAGSRIFEVLREFPFVASSDSSAAIAAILTVLGRSAIQGPTPLYAVNAPVPGSGKTLLVNVISMIGLGQRAAAMPPGRDGEEIRKRLLAIALRATPLVLLDNIEGALGSEALAGALTTDRWSDRRLGFSEEVQTPLRAVWFATGNGLEFKGDLGRRVIPIDLDPQQEHPEDRAFRIHDLLAHVEAQRPALAVAALTILRGYFEAGRPPHGQSKMGSFEAWDDVVRGACIWLGYEDPLLGRVRIREQADRDLESLRRALSECRRVFGAQGFTLASLVQFSVGDAALSEALQELSSARGSGLLNAKDLGYAFRQRKGRRIGGMRFETSGKAHGGAALWRVVLDAE